MSVKSGESEELLQWVFCFIQQKNFKIGSRTIAPEENCSPSPKTNPNPNPNPNQGTTPEQLPESAPTLKLTLSLTETSTLTGGQFSSGVNCPDSLRFVEFITKIRYCIITQYHKKRKFIARCHTKTLVDLCV